MPHALRGFLRNFSVWQAYGLFSVNEIQFDTPKAHEVYGTVIVYDPIKRSRSNNLLEKAEDSDGKNAFAANFI